MRIAIVTESFFPYINGVTNTLRHLVRHYRATGVIADVSDLLILAPGHPTAAAAATLPPEFADVPIRYFPARRIPRITSLPVALPSARLITTLRRFRPDIIHLASPFSLGASAALAGRLLGIPTLAVYQTDIPGYTGVYRLGALGSPAWAATWLIHRLATRTLAPSRATMAALAAHHIPRVHYWPRGVDTTTFTPDARSPQLAHTLSPDGAPIVAAVGRLAPEKALHHLASLNTTRTHLVIIGDGPDRGRLETLLPTATFTGHLTGHALAQAIATADIVVHPGPHDTFGQTIQEALACGVPVIAAAAGGPLDLIRPLGHDPDPYRHITGLSPTPPRFASGGPTGILLDPDTFGRDLPAAVEHVMAAPGQLRCHTRQSVSGQSWEQLAQMMVGHYRELLAG